MENAKLLDNLIKILFDERGEEPPCLSEQDKAVCFRALCNMRPPMPVSEEFLRLQDEYLSFKTTERGVVDINAFEYKDNIALWQGDITRLNADAIVNACNSSLLGCFQPLHNCIDNRIHSNAGVQVRLDCNELMKGGEEPNGRVRVTRAYNLPCKYIFHTVGPIVYGRASEQNAEDLKNCYLSCFDKATAMGLSSIAFCCISTGVYGYPKGQAAELAVHTLKERIDNTQSAPKIIFDVFEDTDYDFYKKILG